MVAPKLAGHLMQLLVWQILLGLKQLDNFGAWIVGVEKGGVGGDEFASDFGAHVEKLEMVTKGFEDLSDRARPRR